NIPTPEELDAVDGPADVPAQLVDRWLGSEEFVAQAVRRHRDLLWNNVRAADLIHFQTALSTFSSNGSAIYWRRTPARLYRGDNVACDDAPAKVSADGVIQYRVDSDGYRREGWVMVEPYWAPGTQIKVCAWD